MSMSYQEKYLKYKNKYLALKSKENFNNSGNNSENNLGNNLLNNFSELNESESEQSLNFFNPKIIDLNGGSQLNTTPQESEIETENNQSSSDTISSLFNQTGGQEKPKEKPKKKVKSNKHFFHDKSDSDLLSSSTLSEADSDSEFSSSEVNW